MNIGVLILLGTLGSVIAMLVVVAIVGGRHGRVEECLARELVARINGRAEPPPQPTRSAANIRRVGPISSDGEGESVRRVRVTPNRQPKKT